MDEGEDMKWPEATVYIPIVVVGTMVVGATILCGMLFLRMLGLI